MVVSPVNRVLSKTRRFSARPLLSDRVGARRLHPRHSRSTDRPQNRYLRRRNNPRGKHVRTGSWITERVGDSLRLLRIRVLRVLFGWTGSAITWALSKDSRGLGIRNESRERSREDERHNSTGSSAHRRRISGRRGHRCDFPPRRPVCAWRT